MDLSGILESLARQVPAREISIAMACSRIEAYITSMNREDARILRHALPALLKLLLGSPDSQGWLEMLQGVNGLDYLAVLRLLSPKGTLFSALLGQVPDSSFFYEVPAQNFPQITQKIIAAKQFDLLPTSVYDERLVADGQCLRLNIVEYFLFYLVFVMSPLSPSPAKIPLVNVQPPKLRSIVSRLISLGVPTASMNIRWTSDAASEAYSHLISEYLGFMCPRVQSNGSQVESILTTQLPSFKSNWTRTELAARYSAFFTGVIVEFWLNLYTYRVDVSGIPCSEPVFQLPTLDFLLILQPISRHYAYLFAAALASGGAAPAAPGDNTAEYRILGLEAFEAVSLALYRYFRVALTVWPIDGTLPLLVDVWTGLVAPWTYMEPSLGLSVDEMDRNFLKSWRPFVFKNFHLYIIPYRQFLIQTAKALNDFRAAGTCRDISEEIGRLTALLSASLSAMGPIVAVFEELKRLETSKNLELTDQLKVLEPETFKPATLFTDVDTRSWALEVLENLQSLLNCFIREKYFSNEGDDFPDNFAALCTKAQAHYGVPQSVKDLITGNEQLSEYFSIIFDLCNDDFSQSPHRDQNSRPSLQKRRLDASSMDHLQFKLRAIPKIPSIHHQDSPARSYEIALLIPLLKLFSTALTHFMRSFLFSRIEKHWNVRLPPRIWQAEINLRFMAAYPNIIFTILFVFAARVFIKLMF